MENSSWGTTQCKSVSVPTDPPLDDGDGRSVGACVLDGDHAHLIIDPDRLVEHVPDPELDPRHGLSARAGARRLGDVVALPRGVSVAPDVAIDQPGADGVPV